MNQQPLGNNIQTKNWINLLIEVDEHNKNFKQKYHIFKTKDGSITKKEKLDKGDKELSIREITLISLEKMRGLNNSEWNDTLKKRTLRVINAEENKTYSLFNHFSVAVAIVLTGSLYYWFKEKKELEKLKAAVDLSNQHKATSDKIKKNERCSEKFDPILLRTPHITPIDEDEELSSENESGSENFGPILHTPHITPIDENEELSSENESGSEYPNPNISDVYRGGTASNDSSDDEMK